jgi:surface antigen
MPIASTLQRKLSAKNRQSKAGRLSNLPANVAVYASVFVVITGIIAIGYDRPASNANGPRQLAAANALSVASASSKMPSVDAIVANDVAASLTEQANLPIATTVANTSVSLAAQSELAQSDDTVISKPQIVQMDEAGRSVQVYRTKAGDTATSVAQLFGVSVDTVRWANNIVGDALEPNRDLKILPVNGVLHTVKDNESVESIANKYGTSEARIKLLNDLDISNPVTGQQIIVPDGLLPETERPGYQAPVRQQQSFGGGSGGRIATNVFATAGNRYAPGNCTWYAYERRAQLGRPIGSFWGNANTWGSSAISAGRAVNNIPAAGAILVDRAGYYGHVGIVESVKGNGDIVITEMNNSAYGGFNIVNTRTISAGQAAGYQYIH